MAVVSAVPLRVTRLDEDGHPTGEIVLPKAFVTTFTDKPAEDNEFVIDPSALKEINFTMELCWTPGSRRGFIEAMAGVDFWKHSERVRKRYAHRARKIRRRQR